MMNGTMLDMYARLRVDELLQEAAHATPSRGAVPAPGWRRRAARALIRLGACLDADASAAAVTLTNRSPRLHRSDA
jgi:hypothetical protein